VRYVIWPNLLAACCAGAHAQSSLPAAPPIEATFRIPNLGSEPFAMQVWVHLRADATGETLRLPTFHVGGDLWQLRHTPAAPGAYSITGISRTEGGGETAIVYEDLQPATFDVSPEQVGHFVCVDPARRQRFRLDDGSAYFPVGICIGWAWARSPARSPVLPLVLDPDGSHAPAKAWYWVC
jgi:hypothetical protein